MTHTKRFFVGINYANELNFSVILFQSRDKKNVLILKIDLVSVKHTKLTFLVS